jgi:glyoxylase-like metal-dependent hydrolase (beta-lactamase superfamily II)
MKVETVISGRLDNNTYLIFNEGSEAAIVIDPSYGYEKIDDTLQKNGIASLFILLTHGHIDHFFSVVRLKEKYRVKLYIHRLDADKLTSPLRSFAFFEKEKPASVAADVLLEDGEELTLDGIAVKVLHLPGHSKGGAAYVISNFIFSGDTLFAGDYGRYDFYDGDFDALYNSVVNVLFALEGDYTVYSGHGEASLLSRERIHNSILTDYGKR